MPNCAHHIRKPLNYLAGDDVEVQEAVSKNLILPCTNRASPVLRVLVTLS